MNPSFFQVTFFFNSNGGHLIAEKVTSPPPPGKGHSEEADLAKL